MPPLDLEPKQEEPAPLPGSSAALAPLASAAVDLDDVDPDFLDLVEQFTQRTLAGETVDVDRLLAGHAEWAESFRRLMPTLRTLATIEEPAPDPATIADGAADAGKVFGDFRIVREIGRGGMGVVYEARQITIGRRVALKVLPAAAALDPKAQKRFQLEAQVAGLLQHPRIVPVHAVGSVGDVPYYAMQYIEGGSLARLATELRGLVDRGSTRGDVPSSGDSPSALALGLLTGRFAGSGREPGSQSAPGSELDTSHAAAPQSIRGRAYLRTVARLGVQVAGALDYAHDQGIVHRDIKPANLLLDRQGEVWVADFGMADVQGDAGLTMTGDLPGTLRYMSPEQAGGKRALIDRRTDIYSLGATLYELLTLQPAIVGGDRAEIIRRIAEDEPEPIRRLNSAVPIDLATIVTKALSKEPARRYETALQLADDLERFLDGRSIAARPVGPVARTWRWCRRKPVPAGLTAALALALVVGFSGITWNWLAAQVAEKKARAQAAKADAINTFLIDKLLGQASPIKNPGSSTLTLRAALDHAAADVGTTFQTQPQTEAAIRMALGRVYHELADYANSEAHYRAAKKIYDEHPESSVETALEATSELGHLLWHLGRYAEAEPIALAACAETKKRLEPGHDLRLRSLHSLASLYGHEGRPADAEAIYRSVIREAAAAGRDKAPAALDAMSDLGNLLGHQKGFTEAEQLLRAAEKLQVEVRGPDHPSAMTTRENLGLLLLDAGRHAEAERMLRESVETHRRVFGPDHPTTLSTAVNHAVALAELGKRDEAEKLAREALTTCRRTLPAGHKVTARAGKLVELISNRRKQLAAPASP